MSDVQQASCLSEQMERGELMSANCPSRQILQHVTSRWGGIVAGGVAQWHTKIQ